MWDTDEEGLTGLTTEVKDRLERFKVKRVQQIDDLFGGLVDKRRLRRTIDTVATPPRTDQEQADVAAKTLDAVSSGLEDVRTKVANWEAAFRDGDEFTADDHADLQEEMQRLVAWRMRFPRSKETASGSRRGWCGCSTLSQSRTRPGGCSYATVADAWVIAAAAVLVSVSLWLLVAQSPVRRWLLARQSE